MGKRLTVGAIGLILALGVLAQSDERPAAAKAPEGQVGGLRFMDVAEVTVVNVDVSVTDSKRKPVRGLTTADFEVYQNGKLQQITNFAEYTRALPETSNAPAPTAVPTVVPTEPPVATGTEAPVRRDPRFVVLYVDNENIMPFNRNRVLTKVTSWVRENLQAPDQAMVVGYQRSLKVLQPFTTNPDDVVEALRAVRTYTGGRSEVNSTRKDIEDFIYQNAEQGQNYDQAMDRVRSFAREQRSNLTFTVRAIQELIGMMSGLPGKKAIVYVSDGLPMNPGLELYYEIQERYRDPSALTQSFEYEATGMFRSLVTSATASGVTFYTIDARGLEADLGIEAENRTARSTVAAGVARTNYQDSLVYIAEQTGGIAIINTNDVSGGLERIADDLHSFYSLGYRLVPTGTDRMHRIEVKVKGHPEYKLNYRRNFIEKSLPTRIADRVMSGLAFDLEDNPLAITITAGVPAPASSGRWTLPVETRVPIEKIALIPDGDKLLGYIMVYYAARDDEGKQSDLQRVEHRVEIPQAEYEDARRKNYLVSSSLLLESGTYRISVGVRDQFTNQAGYAMIRRAVHPEQK
ncbi:MAG: VWA domain-containing protein [Acidobacteriota bacterium]